MSAERGKPRRGAKAGDLRLRARQDGAPIVVRIDADTATRLGVDLDRLGHMALNAVADGRLRVWGKHADGRPVYRLRELDALLHAEEAAGASR